MKIDRLIGILSILLQQEKVTAPYLADKFEVSRRTINRDIEDICKAGIPVVTSQGQNGGISIMDGYRIKPCSPLPTCRQFWPALKVWTVFRGQNGTSSSWRSWLLAIIPCWRPTTTL